MSPHDDRQERYRVLAQGAEEMSAESLDDQKILSEFRRRRLPLLDQIEIASPCSEKWSDMIGSESRRFCGSCNKHVYNLNAMTTAQIEALLCGSAEHPCVRLYRRADGTVLTADCPVGLRRARFRRITSVAVGSLLVVGTWTATLGLLERERRAARPLMGAPPPVVETAGEVAAPLPPPEVKMGDIAPPTDLVMGKMVAPREQPKALQPPAKRVHPKRR